MKKILLVIDMQNDFIDAALGTKEAVAIVENVKSKIKSYEKSNIFATRDTHEENYLETQEGEHLPVRHCIRGTEGWQIRKDIQELLDESKIFDKPTFGSLRLAQTIKEMYENEKGELEVEICGLCTDICVVSNALLLKATLPEMKISLDPKCCAGVTPQKHDAAIETMRSCQIQII
ncbi:cysteine hydrolase family protein [Treponema zioleckii]|uniref:cysteine hydrolase family protein n=1 Tax=Treponema zioleckii TaxID=331680 RepID=UPI00168B36DB|nr:cysteine hydrolase [Treponema zioleckii]